MIEILLTTAICMTVAATIAFVVVPMVTDGKILPISKNGLISFLVWTLLAGILGASASGLVTYQEYEKTHMREARE